MKTFVINLPHRTDRKEQFEQDWNEILKEIEFFPALSSEKISDFGANPNLEWRDPLLDRPLTEGEIGCFLSHYSLWQKAIELNESIIIMEDDVKPQWNGARNFIETAKAITYAYEIIYLAHEEMNKEKRTLIPANVALSVPGYPYWACAYIITPSGAKKLVSTDILDCIIPVDEYLPMMLGCSIPDYFKNKDKVQDMVKRLERFDKLGGVGSPVGFIQPYSREAMGSDTENSPPIESNYYNYSKEFDEVSSNSKVTDDFHVVSVATNREQAKKLEQSCLYFGHSLHLLGVDREWRGGDIENGTGGFFKVKLLHDYLIDQNSFNDNDVIMFVDGYDTFLSENPDQILNRYLDMDADIIFAAEKTCWPEPALANEYPLSHTPYRFLNSGGFIGKVWAIKEIINDITFPDDYDDQWYFHLKYLASLQQTPNLHLDYDVNIKLDHENYIFQCVSGASNVIEIQENQQILNTETKCTSCLLHGNGGPQDKEVFERLFDRVFQNRELPPVEYEMEGPVEDTGLSHKDRTLFQSSGIMEVGPEIMSGSLLTRYACDEIIRRSEQVGSWEQLPGDTYPGQEKRLKEFWPEMYEMIERQLFEEVFPVLNKYWAPLYIPGVKDMFLIKYSPDTQKSLDCHHDSSLVSLSIKLNDGYEGGQLYFYRQDYSNEEIPVGDFIAWPSQVTHGHEGLEVISGTKYSLTIWTECH